MSDARPADAARGIGYHRFDDADKMAGELARAVVMRLKAGIAAHGRASLVVSGGKSPIAFFDALAQADLSWENISITLADERWLPAESEASNEHLVRKHLLVGAAARANFVSLKNAADDPQQALPDRILALQTLPRPFDAVVLGMGDDGHTASLFPGAEGLPAALDPSAAPALVAITPPAAPHRRISLNLAALLDAHFIYVLIQGETKRAVMQRAAAENAPLERPIAAILNQSQVPVDVYWAA